MRRSEKAIHERREIDAVIRSCRVCRLGLVDGDRPYVVPMCFGYDGSVVYLHAAPDGRKIGILRRNSRVCLEFDVDEGLVTGGPQGCNWSLRYRSVIAEGTARFVDEPEAKRRALAAVMAQYAPGAFAFPDAAVARTCVIAVDLETVSGKQSPRAAPAGVAPCGDGLHLRQARREDGSALVALIRALAEFEHLPPPDAAAEARLLEDAFGPRPRFEAWLACVPERPDPVGYAVTFESYSTFVARPTLYLEDVFVLPDFRGRGIGSALLRHCVALAHARGCGRMEWTCLEWNVRAQSIYEAHVGARKMSDWALYRLTPPEMERFLKPGPTTA